MGEGLISEFVTIPKPQTPYERQSWPQFQNSEISMKPEFTTPLNGRTLVMGYNGTLTCAIRGIPRPRVKWFKKGSAYFIKTIGAGSFI